MGGGVIIQGLQLALSGYIQGVVETVMHIIIGTSFNTSFSCKVVPQAILT